MFNWSHGNFFFCSKPCNIWLSITGFFWTNLIWNGLQHDSVVHGYIFFGFYGLQFETVWETLNLSLSCFIQRFPTLLSKIWYSHNKHNPQEKWGKWKMEKAKSNISFPRYFICQWKLLFKLWGIPFILSGSFSVDNLTFMSKCKSFPQNSKWRFKAGLSC